MSKKYVFLVFLLLTFMSLPMYGTPAELGKEQPTCPNILREAVKGTAYEGRTLYAPTDMEDDQLEVFRSAYYKKTIVFPIVAEKDGSYVFLLLRRVGNGWELAQDYPELLDWEGHSLSAFRADMSAFYGNAFPDSIRVKFSFINDEHPDDYGSLCSMTLQIGTRETAGTVLSTDASVPDDLFRDYRSCSFTVDSDGNLQMSMYNRSTFYVDTFPLPGDAYETDIERFSAQDMIPDPRERMTEKVLRQLTNSNEPMPLLTQPDENSQVLCQIAPDALLYVAEAPDSAYCLVCYDGYIGYIIRPE